ncbi:MAG: dienelactone hydrolase family protein [Chloroflexi bacterium]|nr:dienelactone hydrolase family protein [Chloroflexota bacterium]
MPKITTSMVSYQFDGQSATAYEARPQGNGPFPGVIVVQEWWGLDDHITDVTERFAREGYHAAAPDLFHGTVTENREEAMKLTRAMDRDLAVREIDGAIKYIKSHPTSNKKVGVVGYCLGGGMALLAAVHSGEVDAVNPYYGGNPEPIDLVERIQCPILGLYAGRDEANRPSVPDMEAALQRYGKEYECIVYPDAPHAFFNDRQATYREDAAQDAWQRTLAFFGQHLR